MKRMQAVPSITPLAMSTFLLIVLQSPMGPTMSTASMGKTLPLPSWVGKSISTIVADYQSFIMTRLSRHFGNLLRISTFRIHIQTSSTCFWSNRRRPSRSPSPTWGTTLPGVTSPTLTSVEIPNCGGVRKLLGNQCFDRGPCPVSRDYGYRWVDWRSRPDRSAHANNQCHDSRHVSGRYQNVLPYGYVQQSHRQ